MEQLVQNFRLELQQENQKKVLLHKQYEELQETLQRNQGTFTAELQVETERIKLLQENQQKALREEHKELQETSATDPLKEAKVSQETIQEEAEVSEEKLPYVWQSFFFS